MGRIAETNRLTFSTLELVNLVWYRSLCRSFLICMMEVLMFISKRLQVFTEKTGWTWKSTTRNRCRVSELINFGCVWSKGLVSEGCWKSGQRGLEHLRACTVFRSHEWSDLMGMNESCVPDITALDPILNHLNPVSSLSL